VITKSGYYIQEQKLKQAFLRIVPSRIVVMYDAVMITHMKISKVGDIKYFVSNYEEKTIWKNC